MTTASWKVAGGDAFVVDDPSGLVGVEQVGEKEFRVTTGFEFMDETVRERLIEAVVRNGRATNRTRAAADAMVDAACTYAVKDKRPEELETDLASIPTFMRWFVNTYGLHTLAALLHDNLIVDTPNGGALESDTLSDRFFPRDDALLRRQVPQAVDHVGGGRDAHQVGGRRHPPGVRGRVGCAVGRRDHRVRCGRSAPSSGGLTRSPPDGCC